jgi:hypothetical protein
VTDYLAIIDGLAPLIDRLDGELHQRAKADPRVKTLTTLPGVGQFTVPGMSYLGLIVPDINDFGRFDIIVTVKRESDISVPWAYDHSPCTLRGMTLVVAFKGSEGIVLAADSRLTVFTKDDKAPTLPLDHAAKLFYLREQSHIGILTAGNGSIGDDPRSIAGYLPELEEKLPDAFRGQRSTVEEIARYVGEAYRDLWVDVGVPVPRPPDMEPIIFYVAGFNEGEPYGRIFRVVVPDELNPHPIMEGDDDFGPFISGQDDIGKRLIRGYSDEIVRTTQEFLTEATARDLCDLFEDRAALLIPYERLPLQDSVDLSRLLIRVTSVLQDWSIGTPGVGGAVDMATITRNEGFQFVTRKEIVQRELIDVRDLRALHAERLS